MIEDLINQIKKSEIVKILPVTKTDEERKTVERIFSEYKEKLVIGWSTHPAIKGYFLEILPLPEFPKNNRFWKLLTCIKLKLKKF